MATNSESSHEFDAAYARLNAEQKTAVDTIQGPVFVIAGPGTGKTQVLTLRIANILAKTDTPPDGILALTFTDAGASEMRGRLSRFIGSRAAKVRFHTFHGFAESLVSRYPDHFPRIVGAQIATDAERAEILDDALASADVQYLRPFGDPTYYHAAAKNAIQTLKRENVTPLALGALIAQSQEDFDAIPDKESTRSKEPGKMKGEYLTLEKKIAKTRDLLKVYELYEKGLTDRRRYDYDDLILEAVRALTEDENFRREVQEGLLYILADEHQDANRAQNAILELLVAGDERPNLFIVGDEKQAIYRFQGADLDNVQYFRGRFTGTQVLVLKENYRSTQSILDSALSLIAASPDERLSRLPLSSQGSGEGSHKEARPLTLSIFNTRQGEAAYLASEVQRLVADGVPYEDIAILVRRNKDVLWLSERLAQQNIPVTVGSEDALNNRYVRALIRFLTLVAEPRDERLAGVLSLPGFNLTSADVWRITQEARKQKIPILDILGSDGALHDAKVTDAGCTAARTLFETLVHLGRMASLERPAVVAEEALKKAGLMGAILAAPDRAESLASIRAFLTMCEQLSEREHDALLPRALQLVALYDERGLLLPAAAYEGAGRVKLMTVHRAKGREFRYVYLPNLTESAWSTRKHSEYFHVPNVLSGANELEDERRLLYVGITRAKEHAVLSYARTRDDGREETPTPLLEDLDPALLEVVTYDDEAIDTLLQKNERRELIRAAHAQGQPSEDDLQTLNEALFAQGLSPTALNNYLECPWKYFYINLLHIPEVGSKQMLYGISIHAALKAYADRRGRGEEMGTPYLISTFMRTLSRSPLTTRELEELEKKGTIALTAWWQERSFTWPDKTETELSIQVQFPLQTGEQLVLLGKLDRLDQKPGGLVQVIDYKTGKPRSRNDLMGKTASGDGNYYRQLTFYKLLLARAEGPREMHTGVIEFVEPDESGHIRSEAFEITNFEVQELEALIQKTVTEIRTLSFWNTPCDEKDCPWCSIRFGLAPVTMPASTTAA